MRRRGGIRVPGEESGPVAAVKRVFAAVVGRNDEPDLPHGWHQFGTLPDSRGLYGYLGRSRSPRHQELEALAEALRKRSGG